MGGAGSFQMFFYGFLVKVVRHPFDHMEGVIRALSQAGSQAVAEFIGHDPGFSVYDLQGSLRAGGNAEPAAVAFVFVNLNDLPFDFHLFLLYILLKKFNHRARRAHRDLNQ
jgi:hypothetical protein